MTAVERFLAVDAWPPGWGDNYVPTLAELDARAAAIDDAWAKLTDEERTRVCAPQIKCATCKRDYGRGFSPTQAPSCAARIARGMDGRLYLTCHYGSDGDGSVYAVRDGAVTAADPVCDDCVRALKESGALTLLGDYLCDPPLMRRIRSE